jgi:hypothetical protein
VLDDAETTTAYPPFEPGSKDPVHTASGGGFLSSMLSTAYLWEEDAFVVVRLVEQTIHNMRSSLMISSFVDSI